MSLEKLQAFIGHHTSSATGIAALGAILDAKAKGTAIDPQLLESMHALLGTLGLGDALDGVGPEESVVMLNLLRALDGMDARMLLGESLSRGWNYRETGILESIGVVARIHAVSFTRQCVPECEGLGERLRRPGAAIIDVGVGVAGTAISLAQMWPEARLVGIDVWQPSLALARENVDRAGLAERIELREQSVESLGDRAAYDAAYYALAFIPERAARAGFVRTLEALRPGGWIVTAGHNFDGMTPEFAASMRLRSIQWGGPLWNPRELEDALRSAGYVSVRSLPAPPGALVVWSIGRKAL